MYKANLPINFNYDSVEELVTNYLTSPINNYSAEKNFGDKSSLWAHFEMCHLVALSDPSTKFSFLHLYKW